MKYITSLLFVALVCWLTYSCSNGKNIRKTKQGGKIAEKVAELKAKGEFKDVFMLEPAQITGAKKFPYAMIETAGVSYAILQTSPDNMKLTVPINGRTGFGAASN